MRKVRVRAALYPLVVSAIILLSGCAGSGRDGDDAGLARKRSAVVAAGLSQIGSPYVYGAESPGTGFDCSGLTYYAHQAAGLSIPRAAIKQRDASKPVSVGNLRPGDMVFFKTGPSSYHVGLMVDQQRFVHASVSKRKVRMDRLDTPYWQGCFLGAGTYLR